jgi:hypothetical protein
MPAKRKYFTEAERVEARRTNQRAYEARKREADADGFRVANNEAAARWREKNRHIASAATKAWRKANRDKFNASRRAWRAKNLLRAIFLEARSRAKARGIEFTIEFEDIPPMGDRCPLFGHAFPPPDVRRTDLSPSLDRIDSEKGYVKGNVWIVGYRANLIKNDGTAEEHELIAAAMRKVQGH